jgi:hypothetical protein
LSVFIIQVNFDCDDAGPANAQRRAGDLDRLLDGCGVGNNLAVWDLIEQSRQIVGQDDARDSAFQRLVGPAPAPEFHRAPGEDKPLDELPAIPAHLPPSPAFGEPAEGFG